MAGSFKGRRDHSCFSLIVPVSHLPPFQIRHAASFVAREAEIPFVQRAEPCNWLSVAIQAERVTFHTLSLKSPIESQGASPG